MTQSILAPLAECHLLTTLEWLQSETLREQIDMPTPPVEEYHFAIWKKRFQDKSRRDFAIISNEYHVGNCGLAAIDLERKKAELWIYLGPDRNKGIGTVALQELLTFGFKTLDLNKIFLRVLSNNSIASKFYETQGFVREGTARQDSLHNGKFVDAILYSILRSEA